MSTVDRVTDFKLEQADGQPVRIADLMKAISAHYKEKMEGESFCCSAAWGNEDERMPLRFRWLVAFAVEGENEADYVHVGAIIQGKHGNEPTLYMDFGFAKLWKGSADARAVANEVQRFLNAARWN